MIKYNFKNKLVLVLASSKGIGFELAKSFFKNNADVAICGRSLKNLDQAKKKLESIKKNNKIEYFKTDLSKKNEIKKLILNVKKKFKREVDILINNSGGPEAKAIIKTKEADWEYAINNNLTSFIRTSLEVITGMKKKRWGRIVNLTSSTAKEPAQNMVLSNVTRAGVLAFAKTLSKEIKTEGVTVNSILTGAVMTDRLTRLIKKNKKISLKKSLKNLNSIIPVQHVADPNEFIQLVLFLCSEEASYVNGAAIPIDGGLSNTIF